MKEIAIIGMSSHFPGAKNYCNFWKNLAQGKNNIREIELDRWDNQSYYSPSMTNENKMISKWGAFLDNIKGFDNDFFGILPDEARSMDPQTRLLLQETWHCIEDASINLKELQQSTVSVYTAIFSLDHFQHMARRNSIDLYACLGSYPCMTANRISHFFKFTGTSFSLDAACASSLTALHEAKLSLRSGSSDYAVVGAANIISHPWHNISMSKARLLSPDGQCKTFDKAANGYVRGEGIAVLLLTSKNNALKKNHRIHAILKGTAVNHCAGSRAITTPSFEAQKKVIQLALRDAQTEAEEIDFIETHGTGTALGDAIEFSALTEVFSSKKEGKKIPIGSVKTNIGHLEAAAGLAGVIKAILMMKHNQIPPHLHLIEPNPLIDFGKSPFEIYQELTNWPAKKRSRLAGISSMGFGGVNSHVILEEFIPTQSSFSENRETSLPLVFILSAASLKSLHRMIDRWTEFFTTYSLAREDLSFVCSKMLRCAGFFKFRTAVLVNKDSKVPLSFPLPQSHQTRGPKDIAIAITDLISETILPILKPFYPWFLTKAQIEQTSNFSQRARSFLATYLIGAFLLKMGITPKIIAGQGDAQIVASLLSKAIHWETALEILENKQRLIKGKCPIIPLWDNASDSVLFSTFLSKQKCEKIRQGLLNLNHLDEEIFQKIASLIESQPIIKQYLESIEPFLRKYQLSLNEILAKKKKNWNPKEAVIINLCFLTNLLQLNKKYKADFLIGSNSMHLLFMAKLISDEALRLDSLIEALDSPAQFFNLLNSVLRSHPFLTDHFLPILYRKKEIQIQLMSEKKIDLSSEPFQNCSLIYLGNRSSEAGPVNDLDEAIRLLIAFWLEGREIAWGKYAEIVETKKNVKHDLPNYEFDLKSF